MNLTKECTLAYAIYGGVGVISAIIDTQRKRSRSGMTGMFSRQVLINIEKSMLLR